MNQRRHKIGGSALPVLLLTLLLFVAQAACRPSTDNESDIATLPEDADNVEFHHVKVVDGVMHEDHPVIMYKEDFVGEDYDPSKNETKVSHRKFYKQLKRTRHHHTKAVSEPVAVEEKIVFDVLPETPILMGDDDSGADNFEVAQLVQPSKEESLQKYPKKYHSRHRREAYNPYARQSYKIDYYAPEQHRYYLPAPAHYYLPSPQQNHQRYPTIGKKPKYRGKLPIWQTSKPPTVPMSIDSRDTFGNDNENSLFHNSNPDDADFTAFNNGRPDDKSNSNSNANNWQSPPVQEPEPLPIWGPSEGRRPNNGPARRPTQTIQTTQRPAWSPPLTTRRPLPQVTTSGPPPQTSPKVSSCVWAIVNCCSQGSDRIRYKCFEEFGCHGAFWGVNPCADNIRDGAISSLMRSFA